MRSETSLAFASTIFLIVAGWFLYAGFSIEVAVTTEAGVVANLQLMHIQSINIAISIGAAIVSAVLAVGSSIVSALRGAEPD